MRVVIVGCGRMGASLAAQFAKDQHQVTVVDIDENAFRELDENFPGEKVLGDGTNIDVLNKAKAKGADLFLSVTNKDNTNIMTAQVVMRQFEVKRNICRVDDPLRARAYKELGLETFCPTSYTVEILKDICLNKRSK